MFCPRCGKELEFNKVVCDNCGFKGKEMLANCGYGMKWYNFLVKFLLIFTAVMYALNAIGYLSGVGVHQTMEYDPHTDLFYNVDMTEAVYEEYPGMRGVDIAMGLVYAGLVVCYVLVRGKLKNFDKKAPRLVIILFAAEVAVVVLYAMAAQLVGVENNFIESLPSIVTEAVYLALNYIYFKKRKHLFIYDENNAVGTPNINIPSNHKDNAKDDAKPLFKHIEKEDEGPSPNDDTYDFFK